MPSSIEFQSTFAPPNLEPAVQSYQRSSSPEIPPEIDYTSWFEPQVSVLSLNAAFFPPASVTPTEDTADLNVEASEPGPSQVAPPLLGFSKASNKGFIMPSAAALLEAENKIRTWQESDPEPDSVSRIPPEATPVKLLQNTSLDHSDDSFSAPDTPSPAGPSDHAGFRRAPTENGGLPSFSSPSLRPVSAINSKPKAFKSPLAKAKHPINLSGTNYSNSPLNPNRGFALASSHYQPHALASTPTKGPAVASVRSALANGFASGAAGFSTPTKHGSIADTSQSIPARNTPAKFVTPFKPGMKPSEMGRGQPECDNVAQRTAPTHDHPVTVPAPIRPPETVSASPVGKGKVIRQAFNLSEFISLFVLISMQDRTLCIV